MSKFTIAQIIKDAPKLSEKEMEHQMWSYFTQAQSEQHQKTIFWVSKWLHERDPKLGAELDKAFGLHYKPNLYDLLLIKVARLRDRFLYNRNRY